MNLTPRQAAKHLLMLANAAESFPDFVRVVHPNFALAPFQLQLAEVLDKLEKGTLTNADGVPQRRLMLNMPPRHGKSWLCSVLFPAYYIGRKPAREVLATSYNAELAKHFGRQVRNLCQEKIIGQVFPSFQISQSASAADDWLTTENGHYFATGVGGGTPGRAANLLLIDDPIKARAEAQSPTYRNHVWSYYVSSLVLRKQPEVDGTPAIEIIIQTRWHPDDPCGRIIDSHEYPEWHHISLDAYQQELTDIRVPRTALPKDDPRYVDDLSKLHPRKRYIKNITRTVALWPDRFPMEELQKIEKRDPFEFAALYRQQPYIRGGNLLKSGDFQSYSIENKPVCPVSIIAMDTAFKDNQQADYSVMLHLGLTQQDDIVILDLVRKRVTYPNLKRACITLNARLRGSGLRGFYIEDKASGQSLLQELRKESGITVIPYRISQTDKVTRANLIMPIIEGGRVFLPDNAPWLDSFVEEIEQFPHGRNDDQVDALVMGIDVLSRMTAGANAQNWSTPLSASASGHLTSSLLNNFNIKDLKRTNIRTWGE